MNIRKNLKKKNAHTKKNFPNLKHVLQAKVKIQRIGKNSNKNIERKMMAKNLKKKKKRKEPVKKKMKALKNLKKNRLVARKKLLQFHFVLNQLNFNVVQLIQDLDNVAEITIVIDLINKDQHHQVKASKQHHLNNMMNNKVHIVVDHEVVVEVVNNVVQIVVLVKVVQMLILMRQHLTIQMIFPLFQNSKMVKLTEEKTMNSILAHFPNIFF
jgi:hypothetical protein